MLLNGCGNDDTSIAPASTTTTTPTSPTESSGRGNNTAIIRGQAIDGYIRGATACLDMDYSGTCSTGDVYATATTDDTGNYTIYTVPANVGNYPIVVYAGPEAYDMQRQTYFTKPLLLTAPVGTTIITPITTLIKADMDAGKTQIQAEASVSALLGVDSSKLYSDYIADGDSATATQAERATDAIQNQSNNYTDAIIELQKEDDNATLTASDFTYGTAIGNSAKTFDWKSLSNASSADDSDLTATVKSQGSKGTAAINGDNLTYTPSSDMNGTDAFIITIANTSGITKDVTVTVTGIDTEAATVTSTSPAKDAVDVAVNSAVSVTFSEAMDASTVTTGTGSLKDAGNNAVAGTVSVSGNTFTFTPSSNLAYSTVYSATLTTAMKDVSGNALASDYTWNFTTGSAPDTTAPTFTSSIPINGATGVQVGSAITLAFSEAILASSATSSTIALKDSNNQAVATSISFIDTQTIKLTPSANLSTGTVYTLTITTGVADLAGNALASNQTISFTTVNSTPTANNFTYGTAIGSSAKTFDWKTLSSATDSDGNALSAVVKTQGTRGTTTINGDNMTYTPSANQTGSDFIVLTISDTLGGSTDITVTVTGIETVAPTITGKYPDNGATGVGPYTWIDINFSEPMDSTTINTTNITLDNNKACQSVDYNATTYSARCYPYVTTITNGLAENTNYTVTVSGVKDSAGNALASDYSWNFTTGSINVLPRLRTGQTKCYDSSNTEVNCDNANALEDDGWYADATNGELGIVRTFSRDGNGIVTDIATGLAWQDDAVVKNDSKRATWTTATTVTCQALNTSDYGDHTDWRLPTIEELITIADKGAYNMAIFNTFINTASSYWSSSTDVSNGDNALQVDFLNGQSTTNDKSVPYFVRCMRGTIPTTSTYVRDDGKQVVLDTSSGLMWQDSADVADDTKIKTWVDALTYCETTMDGFAGYDDWRLPNYEELYQLVDRSNADPAIPPVFQNTASGNGYWSSSTNTQLPHVAWYINFPDDFRNYHLKTSTYYVRCVRGGK